MTGRTGYTAPTNASAPTVPAHLSAAYAHFDPLIGETVANLGALPSSGNWTGRTIWVADIKRMRVWDGSGWQAVSVQHKSGIRRVVANNNTVTNSGATWTDLSNATDRTALELTFVKEVAASKLVITVDTQLELSSGTAGGLLEVGLSIGGTDYVCAVKYPQSTATRFSFSGVNVVTGVAAGSHLVKPRVRYSTTPSVVSFFATAADHIMYTVEETF